MKLEKSVGKTPSGLQYWDCVCVEKEKKEDEADLKHLDQADFSQYITL